MVRTESEAYGLRRQNASLLESALYTSLRPTPMSAPAPVPAAPDSLLRSAKTGDPLRTVLDWLATPAAGDPGHEAAALATCLGVLAQARMDAPARVRVLDIFHDRALACATALKPQLAASGLPVQATLRDAADLLCDALMQIARSYLDALQARAAHKPSRAAGHAMLCLLDVYALRTLTAADVPPGMWTTAHALLMHARMMATPATQIAGSADAEQLHRELIALELAQPPHLAPADFFNIADYVRSYSGAVQIQSNPPHRDLDSWFWIDDEHDHGPTPLLRAAPDPERGPHILYCSCQRLGQVLAHHLDLIDEGGNVADMYLPACLGQTRTRRLLRRLQARWMAMPRRQHARRERGQAIRMLIGFDAIWHLLERRDPAADWDNQTTGWTLLNDSPNGFALRLDTGPTDLVRPGLPVLIKGSGSRNWMICVVRWARSASAGAIDVGVELLSHGAQAATVVFEASRSRAAVPALRLPPLTSHRPHPCIMLPPGEANGRDLLIAHNSGGRYRLGDARLSDLDLQTQAFELFEIEEMSANTSSGGRSDPASRP